MVIRFKDDGADCCQSSAAIRIVFLRTLPFCHSLSVRPYHSNVFEAGVEVHLTCARRNGSALCPDALSVLVVDVLRTI